MYVVCYKGHVMTTHKTKSEAQAKLEALSRYFCNLEVIEKSEKTQDHNGIARSATA